MVGSLKSKESNHLIEKVKSGIQNLFMSFSLRWQINIKDSEYLIVTETKTWTLSRCE